MPRFADLDAITEEQLRATGATKWVHPDRAIGAFIAEMDFGTAPEITASLVREVRRGRFGYLPQDLAESLGEAVAQWQAKRYGWQVDPADVHPVADVITAFRAAIERFTTPGSPVIIPTPAYMPFLRMARSLDRPIIEIPMLTEVNEQGHLVYTHDLDGIRQAFGAGGEILVVCNPHNPTGRILTREELTDLAAVVTAANGRVFADEIWAPLIYDESPHIPYASVSPAAAQHTITGSAASKAFNLPGLKCGQLITANLTDRNHFNATGYFDRHGAANLGAAATVTALTDPAAAAWLDDIVAYLQRNRDELIRFVDERLTRHGVRVTEISGTYIAWLDFSQTVLAGQPTSVARQLVKTAGVQLTDGAHCGEAGIDHTRLVMAMPHPILQRALEQIEKALQRAE
ncbi:aminotransferase class I/II-fold pyridoxal phosphate-dependent enzyme [Auritidibacter ignavus]|uniref:MalY/PatB family protein n=1 Tax=Auritidibacter ignavus TaxID=678932 RepID=UPI00244A6327|nr:aminotransferase class I/II-fold pyridoxal phosphate-dependent enzyme [Auritidibacter ignavus]WGH80532.1 aminotransferase class I/II-fold pyridoxal phosphate-dependent enzyme [Auritidibacter ignavus]